MDFAMIMGIVRTIAASLGGSGMVLGYFETGDAWMGFVGAAITVAAGLFSIVNKQKVKVALATALATEPK